ncbi:MAG: hypothetical protein K2J80_04265 [Oscillospiraceae bacterium]|nr:hypothetical protein [Oscillospiraceae bacterium]
MEIINEANEKFKDKQAEICEPLFDLLRQINVLEKEIYERNEELDRKKEEQGKENEFTPEDKELWADYKKRLTELVKPYCAENLSKNCGSSFGNPQKYSYIDGECKVNFIMKSAKKAVVETHYRCGIDKKHKFVFKDIDGKYGCFARFTTALKTRTVGIPTA